MADPQEMIGRVVGDYRLLRWLGGGGFGNVYLAEAARDHQQAALKLLPIRLTRPDDFRLFINEARTIRLRHPHIVPMLDFGLSQEQLPFLVMEYAPMGTARDRYPRGTRVPLDIVVACTTQVASALQYAHDHHLVHRDVKPENILVRSETLVQLSDFGIATTTASISSASAQPEMAGTILYMAPEQLAGKPRVASDQYALAVVVYEWLTGRRLFRGTAAEVAMQHTTQPPPSFVAQLSNIPQDVETVLFKALAKDPAARFASVQAFASALQQASISPIFASPNVVSPPLAQPAEKSVPGIVPAPVQPPATPMASSLAQTIRQGDEIFSLETANSWSPELPTMTPAHRPALSSTHKRGLSRGWSVLLTALAALLIAGGSSTYLIVSHLQNAAPMNVVHQTYTTYVAQQGIMFGFDAAHTHNNLYEHTLNAANVSQLHLAWSSAPTGGTIESSPAVANGLAYIGSDDNKLYAFDAVTGQPKWAAPTGDSIDSSPAVANGLVYVGSEDGELYAFDAVTGQPKWAAPTGDSIESSPVVVNGLVYVGSHDHKLYAFDAATGQQKWAVSTGGSIESSPSVVNGLVYVGSDDDRLYAFAATNGQPKWTALIVGAIGYSSPAVANGLVYIGSQDNKLYAFAAATGQQKWSVLTGSSIDSSPAVANGMVYISSNDNKLYAFAAATGQPKWAAPTGYTIDSSPTIANGLVYIGSNDNKVYAFAATTGQVKWSSAPTGGSMISSPAVANGMVYIGSEDDTFYAFSLAA